MNNISFLLVCTLLLSLATCIRARDWKHGSGGKVVWAHGCDYYGNDIQNFPNVPGELCGDLCLQKSDCTHFTYNVGICFLKKTDTSGAEATIKDEPAAVCGFVTHRLEDTSSSEEDTG